MNPLPPEQPLKVAILVCPGFVPMDVFGAHTVLGISPNVEIHLVWKTTDEVMGVPTWPTRATTSFADCPDVDVLVVGAIPHEVVDDDEVLEFFKAKAASASAVITVCGGAFLAGAAGLLEGRRATTNFQMLDALPDVGAIPIVGGRIVIDGKFVSAGPVTGSFEAAFAVLERLRGIDVSKMAELTIEYDPRPPYGVGTPDLAGPEMTKASIEAYRPLATAIREHAHRVFLRHRTAASA